MLQREREREREERIRYPILEMRHMHGASRMSALFAQALQHSESGDMADESRPVQSIEELKSDAHRWSLKSDTEVCFFSRSLRATTASDVFDMNHPIPYEPTTIL